MFRGKDEHTNFMQGLKKLHNDWRMEKKNGVSKCRDVYDIALQTINKLVWSKNMEMAHDFCLPPVLRQEVLERKRAIKRHWEGDSIYDADEEEKEQEEEEEEEVQQSCPPLPEEFGASVSPPPLRSIPSPLMDKNGPLYPPLPLKKIKVNTM